jgi:hypothetical protein
MKKSTWCPCGMEGKRASRSGRGGAPPPGPWLAEWRLRRWNPAGSTAACCATIQTGDRQTGFALLDSARRSSNFGDGLFQVVSWCTADCVQDLHIYAERSASLLLSGLTLQLVSSMSEQTINSVQLSNLAAPSSSSRPVPEVRCTGSGVAERGWSIKGAVQHQWMLCSPRCHILSAGVQDDKEHRCRSFNASGFPAKGARTLVLLDLVNRVSHLNIPTSAPAAGTMASGPLPAAGFLPCVRPELARYNPAWVCLSARDVRNTYQGRTAC